MAGAGQPWYMPVTWPLGHVSTAIQKDAEDKPPKPSAGPYLDLTGNLTAMAAALRSWTLAYLAIYYLPGQHSRPTLQTPMLICQNIHLSFPQESSALSTRPSVPRLSSLLAGCLTSC